MLHLEDKWLWDSWYVQDGHIWHAFYLQAPKSIGDPEQRHWNVSYGHATSRDLINWDHQGTCFAPSEGPAWDDYTTWTGSVLRGDDGQWHLFYTGTSRGGGGKHQKLGHAVSDDLHNWQRVGDGLVLDRDERYEEFREGRWHDRAFRDPWVMRDPDGDGWLMYFTARNALVAGKMDAGAIGFATSADLFTWTLQDPVFTGGFGELEVPQVFEWGGTWYCLFCTGDRFWSDSAQQLLGEPVSGNHYLIGDGPRGPWRLAQGPFLDPRTYAGRIVNDNGTRKLMGFLQYDPATEPFRGVISDPMRVIRHSDGRLGLADQV
ncbi:glycoside hydrolase family protein [Actibacterium mucosum]|nr:levansucrase [Actibacterium mucosum]